jgi:multidrug efflux pump subunit AcrA (membrane-fusion protein)
MHASVLMAIVAAAACDPPGQTEQQREESARAQAAKARTEAEQAAARADDNANKNIGAARADFARTREDYLHAKRLDLVALDSTLVDLEATREAHPPTDKNLTERENRLSVALSLRGEYVSHLRALETSSPSTWDASRAALDKEWDSLNAAVQAVPR